MKDDIYFPLFVNLNNKDILVYGGGKVATRRVNALLEFGANIKVIAPDSTEEVKNLALQNIIKYEQRCYKVGEIDNPYIVLAVTNDFDINECIYKECRKKGILVNVSSDQTKSDFFFPGIVMESPLVVGVTASGKDHGRVRKVTNRIRNILKEESL